VEIVLPHGLRQNIATNSLVRRTRPKQKNLAKTDEIFFL